MAQPETFSGRSLLAILAAVRFVPHSLVGFEWRALAAAIRTTDARAPEAVGASPASATSG
jgi:hypothetical protein